MTAQRWARIKEIFNAALEVPESDRRAYVESTCGSDAELRTEVERLLADHATETLASPAASVLTRVSELAPGEMLAQYRVASKLGEGGMGVVYLAYDTRLQRRVALKVLPPDPDHQQRLMREARAASALNHPNIVTVHEVATANGADFIAMEFVEGRSLDKVIPVKGLPVEKALDYGIQIADALEHAHAAGVVHRDLKPANIIVNGVGRIKLLDFGLARRVPLAGTTAASLTMPGTIAGTPAYMSPEQAEGKITDARSDVFSFGAVLYEMLTGRRAFSGDTTLAQLASILHHEPQPLREVTPSVPGELERVVALCLKKDPAQRFGHVDDLRLQLDSLRQELETKPPAPAQRLGTGRSKRIVVWTLATLALVTLGIARSLLFWARRGSQPPPVIEMTRLTSDPGLTFRPAISPDGKLLAYSSDRGGEGNLDIWVQQVTGGNPIQVTRDPADDSDPTFSADSGQIAFRSERQGGGIYVVPALGGEARLLAEHGRDPRFSPDGTQLAFWVRQHMTSATPDDPLASVYVVPSTGGRPRRLRPDFVWAGLPIWTPEGNHLLFTGARDRAAAAEWWVTPLEDGPPVNTGANRTTREGGLVALSPEIQGPVPKAWAGDSVIYSANAGDSSNLWQVPISTSSWRATGTPRQLTFGTGTEVDPSVSSTGRVVLASLSLALNVWEMPVDANGGRVTGEKRRLTREAGLIIDPALSRDGGKLAYVTGRRGRGRLRIRDLRSGKEAAVSTGTRNELYPAFSPDGSKLIFKGAISDSGQEPFHVAPAGGGVAEKVCERCGFAPAWSSDGTKIAYDYGLPRYVGLLDLATGTTRQILKHSTRGVIQAQFSPGDKWIAFDLVEPPDRTRLMVARFSGTGAAPESEWISVTDGSGFDIRPRWSPDGNLLYFTSDREGFRCIFAQRLDPSTKRPVGPPLDVQHFHDPRHLLVGPPNLGFSLARDKMAFNLMERTGNIWMFQLPEQR